VEPPATPVTLGLDLGLSDAAESYASDTGDLGDSSDAVAVQAFESVPVVAEQCQIPYLLLVTVTEAANMVLFGSQDNNTILNDSEPPQNDDAEARQPVEAGEMQIQPQPSKRPRITKADRGEFMTTRIILFMDGSMEVYCEVKASRESNLFR
jgi:hypothetical protein